MTFPEIFEKFKNHSYIRRECWSEYTFIQLRHTIVKQIHLVMFATADTPKMKAINTLNDDIRLTAEDLLADDWIDIEDLVLKKKETPKTFWDYVDTLEDGSDDWRYVMQLGQKYHNEGKNPDEYLEEIIKKVNKK